MESRKDQLQVLEHFNKALRADKARPQIAQLSELGLVELTRKRQGQNIYELFGRSCPTCGGLGHVVHLPGETEERGEPIGSPREPEWSGVPTREVSRTLPPTRNPEPRETYAGFGEAFGLDTESDQQDFNLINHPSYQELGDANNNRRRRRRRLGLGESVGKDETRTPGNSLSLLSERETEIDAEPEITTPEFSLPVNPKVAWTEKVERAKPTKPEQVKPVIEPPETIFVEMSPEEQEIYALMGVSPLMHLNQEIKNSKSAIVHVALPGQALAAPVIDAPPTPATITTPAPDIDDMDQPVNPAVASIPDVSTFEESLEFQLTDESEAISNSPIRRRRRRSSALDNGEE